MMLPEKRTSLQNILCKMLGTMYVNVSTNKAELTVLEPLQCDPTAALTSYCVLAR